MSYCTVVVVAVDLLFCAHSKQQQSCLVVNLTTLFLGRLKPPKRLTNRAYPENANSNTCAPNTLKFHAFCGLCVTKQCFKFELDILNGSGVIAT